MTDIQHEIDTLAKDGLSEEIVAALKAYYSTTALVALISPISEAIYNEVFALYKPVVVPFVDNDGVLRPEVDCDDVGNAITESKDLYKASNDVFKQICDYHIAKLNDARFTAKKGLCPLLVAENNQRESVSSLINVMAKHTGISSSSLLINSDRDKYVVYLVGLLTTIADSHNIDLKG